MATRSNENNPEQKTRNGINNMEMEPGKDIDPVNKAK